MASPMSPVIENSCSCQPQVNKRLPTISSEEGNTFAFRILCSFTNTRRCIQTINQGVLSFTYCRQNPLELSDTSGVYPIRTFSLRNIRKRNEEYIRCDVKTDLTLENGQLQSRTIIYEM